MVIFKLVCRPQYKVSADWVFSIYQECSWLLFTCVIFTESLRFNKIFIFDALRCSRSFSTSAKSAYNLSSAELELGSGIRRIYTSSVVFSGIETDFPRITLPKDCLYVLVSYFTFMTYD